MKHKDQVQIEKLFATWVDRVLPQVEGGPMDGMISFNLFQMVMEALKQGVEKILTESPSDSEAVDTESPVQYGTAFEADCEDGTWTFKMDEPFYVMAGRFKIIPLKK